MIEIDAGEDEPVFVWLIIEHEPNATNRDPPFIRDCDAALRDRAFVCSANVLEAAQSGAQLQPLWQPREPTKAAFLARARALRDEAVREGDQAYGAVVARNGVIVGEGRNYVVLQTDPTAHSELLAVRDAARRLGTRDLSECEVYSTATPCAMCQGALY
jgi:hypothetical protein